jgi:hypothetical protein
MYYKYQFDENGSGVSDKSSSCLTFTFELKLFSCFCSEPIGLINKSCLNTFGHSEFDEGSGSTKLLLAGSFSAK